jgi:hypothetical protein
MSARDDILTGLRQADDRTVGDLSPEQILDAYRAEVLAEAKVETVAWLVKKAAEGTGVGDLASKVDRGAVRVFLGTAHYRDALDAHRAEVLAEDGQAYPGELAMLHGLVATLTAVAEHGDLKDLRKLLEEHKADDTAARAETPTPDFFQPGRGYQRRRWLFQCLAVAPNPFNGETRAVGFLYRPGEPATATALDPDDWAHGGWVDVTEGGAT